MIQFNLSSNDHLSLLLFGGEIVEKIKKPILNEDGHPIVIKSGINKGKIKEKLTDLKITVKGLGFNPLSDWKLKKEGFYKTSEEVLNLLSKENSFRSKLVDKLLELRKLHKQLSSFYESHENLTYKEDSCIHCQYNQCGTETGRLSCKGPNLQQIPDKDKTDSKVKQHFITRY